MSSNLYSVPSCGLRAIMLPATEAPVAITCTWPRDEGRDGGVVVLEALDVGAGRRDLGELHVLDGAARHADDLAGQVGEAA